MSLQQDPTLKTLCATGTGDYACPKCSDQVESMDALVGHISDQHDPYLEFAQRWGGAQ